MATTKTKSIYFITVVACLGGLLFGYEAVISGTVGALDEYFITPLENNHNIVIAAMLQFKIIIGLCIIAISGLIVFFILIFLNKNTTYAIIGFIIFLGGSIYYSQFLTLPGVLTENIKNSILGFMVSSALGGCIIGASLGDKTASSIGKKERFD